MTDRPRVVVTEPIHPDGLALLTARYPTEAFGPGDAARCLTAMESADAVLVRTMVIPAEQIARCPSLRVIAKHGAGVDNLPMAAIRARGILVANTGDANAESVAEGAVSLMLAVCRRTVPLHQAMTTGHFDIRWGLALEGLCGRTLGIIGLGNIGRRVAAMCRHGFGMSVLAYAPRQTAEQVAAAGATRVDSLDALLAAADVVTLHASKRPGEPPLIGARELALMKPHAVLINTGRGGLVDEAALAEALRAGRLWGAGLDVLEQEPPPADHPLFALDNVVLSPHVAGMTESARRLMAIRAAEAVIAGLEGRRPDYPLTP